MKKKLLPLVLLLLLPTLSLMLQFVPSVSALHDSKVDLFIDVNPSNKPYWNGMSTVNYNFTVYNLEDPDVDRDPIVKVVISWEAEGFKPEKFYYPPNWGAVYEPVLKQITFESTDYVNYNIPEGEDEDFTVYFTSFPEAEDVYEFVVSTTDIKKEGDVNYVPSYIDKRAPIVELVFPTEDGYVFDKGADVWINATVEDDPDSPYPSGIREVHAVVEGTHYPMKYDSINKVWYGRWEYPTAPITEDGADYAYHVEAWDWASNWVRDPTPDWHFYWYLTEGIKPDPMYGIVGTKVTINGFGFDKLSSGNIEFYNQVDHGVVTSFSTDKYGFFTTTCTIPETSYGLYWFKATDAAGVTATAKFEVIPWITMSPSSGPIGTKVEVKGTGFLNSKKYELWYGGVADDRLDDSQYEHTTWDGSWTFRIRTVGKNKRVATPTTSPTGSFTASFNIPESWGGYHPIWVKWGEEPVWPNEQIFRVLPRISIDPSSGVSGQYVHLFGDGFSAWEYYDKWKEGITVPEDFQTNPGRHVEYPNLIWDILGEEGYTYERTGTGFVLDFGPNQRYIDESHFVLNGEADIEWYDDVYYPMKIDATGTIIYLCTLHKPEGKIGTVGKIGSHFLQVPFLQPEDYDITAYRFNTYERLRHYYYDTKAKKWVWETEFKYEHDYSYTESASTVFTIESLIVEADISEILDRLDELEAKIIGVVNGAKGEILLAIDTTEGVIITEINKLDPIITRIDENVATINTKVGEIKISVDDIQPKVDDIHDDWATVVTKVGFIEGKVTDVDWSDVTTTKAGVATIETDVGDLKASIPDDLKDKLEGVIGNTTTTLPITAVLAAIAAIASCIAVVVLLRRLKVAG